MRNDRPNVNVTRISFLGLNPNKPKDAVLIQKRFKIVVAVLNTFSELLSVYPFFLDDEMRGLPAEQMADYMVRTGSEFFHVHHPATGRVLGFHVLENIKPHRSAILHSFMPSEVGLLRHRISSMIEVLAYAFKGDGLDLLKVKLHVTAANTPAVRFCQWLGARQAGVLEYETFHAGKPYDMVIFEISNPIITNSVEEPINEVTIDSAESTGVTGDGAVQPSVQLHSDSSAELRRIGDAAGDSDTPEQQAPDSGRDGDERESGGAESTDRFASLWNTVRTGGEDQVGKLLQKPVPRPSISLATERP